jgi:hypothetical protein
MEGYTAMSDKERPIFKQEFTRLYGECERCEGPKIKKEIVKDIILLEEAVQLLSY